MSACVPLTNFQIHMNTGNCRTNAGRCVRMRSSMAEHGKASTLEGVSLNIGLMGNTSAFSAMSADTSTLD